MIQSMTAFSRLQAELEIGTLTCELRSINHRYLELNLRLPESLQSCENKIRDTIRKVIQRGKVECVVRFMPADVTKKTITIDRELAQEVCRAAETVTDALRNPALINGIDILKWPGVLKSPETDINSVQESMLQQLKLTLEDFVAARLREGEQLQAIFLERLNAMQIECQKVRARLPAILMAQREKLLRRFEEIKAQVDATRLEQEMVFVAQRIDVTEELERLETHILEVRRCLAAKEPMGRRLDFLMQELNREANTLGSKSVDSETTQSSVELKVLIEQMREQVQNVE